MATQGPTYPASGANYSLGGGLWANPSYCTNLDTNYSTYDCTGSIDDVTDLLFGSNFGFTIPAGATIDGIKVEVRRKRTPTTPGSEGPYDYSIRLFNGGVPAGTDKSAGALWPTTREHWVTFGSSSDTWGRTWTPAEVNASNFGFGYAVNDASSTGGWIAYINVYQITIDYTEAEVSSSQTITLMGVG